MTSPETHDLRPAASGPLPDHVSVVIAGMGPVGMTLALDLSSRGVDVLVLEQAMAATENPRCNTTNARSMEYFRRLGVADAIRRAGLPLDHPTDVVYLTSLTGYELTRFPFSSAQQILNRTAPEFEEWATPEPQHRVSQIYLEPILEDALVRRDRITGLRGWCVEDSQQDGDHVTVTATNVSTGETARIRCSYLVGCDGGASAVRRSVGVSLHGDSRVAERRLSVYFRSEELSSLLAERPGWMYWWYGPRLRGSFVQLDGKSLYLCHARVPEGEDPEDLDADEVLLAAIGRSVQHEKIQVVRWEPRRLVADRFRVNRVLLAGDAAHLWLPLGGFGMNTGIADAMGLSWRLAAVLQGWGGDRLLDDFAAERRSIGEATSRAAMKIDSDMTAVGRDPELRLDSARGAELRATAAELIEQIDRKQWHSQGVQFGARYVDSPGIVVGEAVHDSGEAIDQIDRYVPSVAAGSRLPHYWRPGGTSLFDECGPGWTLLQVGVDPAPVNDLVRAADKRGMPLSVLRLPEYEASSCLSRALVLCRPDLYVAWSDDELPSDCVALLDALLGSSES